MRLGRRPSVGLGGEGHGEGPLKLPTVSLFVFEARSHVAQAGLKYFVAEED